MQGYFKLLLFPVSKGNSYVLLFKEMLKLSTLHQMVGFRDVYLKYRIHYKYMYSPSSCSLSQTPTVQHELFYPNSPTPMKNVSFLLFMPLTYKIQNQILSPILKAKSNFTLFMYLPFGVLVSDI